MPASTFEEHVAALARPALMKLLAQRHSVRRFTDRPVEGRALAALEQEIAFLNDRLDLSVQLCLDNPEAFDGLLAHYGSFRNVRNHIALVGPKSADLDEKCGYAGERLVLLAQALGLRTCWVALTFRKKASNALVGRGQKMALCIALGYGEVEGASHKVKPVEKLGEAGGAGLDGAPRWFVAGIEAAQLAPTAMNQQRFRFELGGDRRTVLARALPAVSCGKVDLGIAKLHFELGANAVSHEWSFA